MLTGKHLLCGMAVAVALCVAVAPAGGSAEQRGQAAVDGDDGWSAMLRYAGEFGGFRIAAAAGAGPNDQVSISYTEIPSPDLLFSSPGGIASPPPPCIAASSALVRCPGTGVTNLEVSLGAGDDRLDTQGLGRTFKLNNNFRVLATYRQNVGADVWKGGGIGERWNGGPGNDKGMGAGGRDRLIGNSGNDRMFGGAGVDFFSGGLGTDFARGGGGDDRGSGGPGQDNFRD